DAQLCVLGGADAIGLNFWPGSKRYLAPEEAARVVAQLPSTVLRVGVFVDPRRDQVLALLDAGVIDVAQLHGAETPAFCSALLRRHWKAIRLDDVSLLAGVLD